MTHVLLLNLVFFLPATCGVIGVVVLYRWIFGSADPPAPSEPEGGSKTPLPSAGPDDLARSA